MNYFIKLLLVMIFLPLKAHQDLYMVNQNDSEYKVFSFSAQKDKFVTGRDNDHLLLWNIKTGLPIRDFGKVDTIYYLKKSKDNRYMLIHSVLDYNDSIRLLDTKKEEIYTIDSKSQIEGSSYLTDMGEDGKYFIFTWGDCKQHIIKVFDIEKKRVIKTFSTNGQDLYSIKLSSKNNFIVTMARDNIFTIWSINGKKIFETKMYVKKGYYRYFDLSISPDAKYVLVGEHLFDVKRNKFIKKFKIKKDASVYFTEDSNKILFQNGDNNLTFWDINKSKISDYFLDRDGNISRVEELNNKNYFEYTIYKVLNNKSITKNKILNSKTYQKVFETNSNRVQYAFSNTQNLMIWHDGKMLNLYDLKKQKNIKKIDIEKVVRISSAIISKDGKYIASISDDKIAIWDIKNNKLLYWIEKKDIDTPLTFNHTGEYFMMILDNSLKIFDTKKGTILTTIKFPNKEDIVPYELYLTSNDKYLVIKEFSERFVVWDFEKNRFIKSDFTMPLSNRGIFSHEDKYAITLVDDKIKLYDMNHLERAIKEFVLGDKNSWVVFDYKSQKIYKRGEEKFLFKRKLISPLSKYSLELIP